MPASPEALLISVVLRNKTMQAALASGANANIFHSHREEWEWLERYFTRYKKTPSRLAFCNHFPDFTVYRTDADDVEHFVDEVRLSHTRHALTGAMREATDLIADGHIDKAVSYMTASMNTVAASIGSLSDSDVIGDWKSVLADAKARKERFDENGMAGIPTGFDIIDRRMGGVGQGQLWVVGARLGHKKTWILLNMAAAAVMNGWNVHFAAQEMTRTAVTMRLHNILSGKLGQRVFESQMLMTGQEPDLSAYREFLRSLPSVIGNTFTVSDTRGLTHTDIRAQLERHHPDIYFLDHLTLSDTGDGGWQGIGQFTKHLARMAGDYGIGVVTAAQLNRMAEEGKRSGDPGGPDHIGGSDQIGQDADVVITTRQRSARVNIFRLAKARHGGGDYTWWMHLDPTKGKFEEISKDKALELIDVDRVADHNREK